MQIKCFVGIIIIDPAVWVEHLAVVEHPTHHVLAKTLQFGGQASRQFYLLIGHEAGSDKEYDIRPLDTMLDPKFLTDRRVI